MTYAKLSDQGVEGANLYPCVATRVADSCRGNVIVAVRLNEREGSKSLNDLRLRLRAGEALQ